MTPLSLVVITRNAEKYLERCLRSVPFAGDVVVLDSGSTDRTREIAENCAARFIVEEWRGYGPQKKRATELAANDWVLNLDADEELSEESQLELQELLQRDPAHAAYAFPRLSHHMGRWIRHGGWYPDWQTRLYDRRKANWTEAVIHEKVDTEDLGYLERPIHHWVFDDLTHQVATNNRYSGLGAIALAEKGLRFSLFNLLVKPKVKFLETYVWKRGFLDGLPGFIIAVGAAYSVFLKWAKLWEKTRRTVDRPNS